jgi:hypothetical protein
MMLPEKPFLSLSRHEFRIQQQAVEQTTSFASTSLSDGTETINTPAFSFVNAENEIRQQWWASIDSVDMSPDVTTFVFPDGYRATYNDQISYPSITHTLA